MNRNIINYIKAKYLSVLLPIFILVLFSCKGKQSTENDIPVYDINGFWSGWIGEDVVEVNISSQSGHIIYFSKVETHNHLSGQAKIFFKDQVLYYNIRNSSHQDNAILLSLYEVDNVPPKNYFILTGEVKSERSITGSFNLMGPDNNILSSGYWSLGRIESNVFFAPHNFLNKKILDNYVYCYNIQL